MNNNSSLDEWLALLESRSPESVFRLGLERVGDIWHRLGIAPPAGRVISVAGTNGKGSCALFCEAVLRASGRKVGTTLSPHLVRFNERIRLDGREAFDTEICRAMARVETVRGNTNLSYFEHAILAALVCFDEAEVDTWVLEVGLGGRLDAVNIVDADVAIIASIGLEHTAWLGDTCEAIGAEKAGILRSGRPLVCGSADMPRSVFERARQLRCPVYTPQRDFSFDTESVFQFDADVEGTKVCVRSRAEPRIAPENAATAAMACALLEQPAAISGGALEAACRQAVNPGRMEMLDWNGVSVVLDLAHNPAAARFLARQLGACPVPGRTRAICGFLSDKDVAGTAGELAAIVDHWHFADTPGARGRSAQEVSACLLNVLDNGTLACHASVEAAIEVAKGVSCTSDRLLVFGSFATVGKARQILHAGQAPDD